MAEGKKSFVLYADYLDLFEELSNEDAGQLVKHLFRYVNDQSPHTKNPLVKVSFILIEKQLKRDLKKYETKKIQWSEAGKASAAARKAKKEQQPLTNVKSRSTDSTVNDNDNVTVNVNDTVNVNVIKKKRFTPPTFDQVKDYFFEKLQNTELSSIEAETFIDHYTNTGWKVGKSNTPMKDWKAAIRNWLKKDYNGTKKKLTGKNNTTNPNKDQGESAFDLLKKRHGIQ